MRWLEGLTGSMDMSLSKLWEIVKDEGQRTDVFELWCWGRLFRVPWTAGDQTMCAKSLQSSL